MTAPHIKIVTYDWICNTENCFEPNGSEGEWNFLDGVGFRNIVEPKSFFKKEIWNGICLLKKGSYAETISPG